MHKWSVIAACACLCAFSTACIASPVRVVANDTLVSHRDPAVTIKLPGSFRYVGKDRFFLTKPDLGKTEECELFAFVDAPDGHDVRRLIWIQFEGYLPEHPALHMAYDSPRHASIGGLDFYEDDGVGSAARTPRAGSDGDHFYSLLASHGYKRGDLRWVRLAHVFDSQRRELMIIYAESLDGTGYTAAQLDEGGPQHAQWKQFEAALRQRAESSVTITPAEPAN